MFLQGELVVVQSLARRKALVDKSVPEQGLTPLMMAASQGHTHIITSLMKDFQPPANLEMININGATALMLAANAGQASTVELLLLLGARSDPIAQRRLTALMMACTHGHHLAARALLDKKARQSARMDTGETALMLASRNGHEVLDDIDIIQMLYDEYELKTLIAKTVDGSGVAWRQESAIAQNAQRSRCRGTNCAHACSRERL
jgi:serine/threonine-protein phosphatase 6 regulatory ankyrin repeat subunit B